MNWQEIALGDCFTIKHGFAFKSRYFGDVGRHVVLTPGNFHEPGGFRLRPGKDRYYTIDPPDDFILQPADLVIAMTEQGEGLLGSSALIPEDGSYLHNQRIGLIENLDERRLDKGYFVPTLQHFAGKGTNPSHRVGDQSQAYRAKADLLDQGEDSAGCRAAQVFGDTLRLRRPDRE